MSIGGSLAPQASPPAGLFAGGRLLPRANPLVTCQIPRLQEREKSEAEAEEDAGEAARWRGEISYARRRIPAIAGGEGKGNRRTKAKRAPSVWRFGAEAFGLGRFL